MDLADLPGQDPVLPLPGSPDLGAGEPRVVAGPVHVQDLAEPLHPEGVPVVVNELKAAPYQFVSPAKYLAALRSMSSSAASLRSLASSSAIRERAVAEDWRGEIDGLDLTLTFLRSKREQARRFQ